MNKNDYNSEDLRFTWRLLVAPIVGQLIGILIGFIFPLDPTQFMSIWLGGALGTFWGFWFGILWHFKDVNRRIKIPYFTLLIIGFLSNAIGFYSFKMMINKLF